VNDVIQRVRGNDSKNGATKKPRLAPGLGSQIRSNQ
jgi:hypothetical protein